MAHNLQITEQGASLYLHKVPGWHGLGTVSDKAERREVVAKAANMAFEANKVDLFAGAGLVPVPGKYAVQRDDNGGILGVVGDDYKIIQWADVFDFCEGLRDFMPNGLIYESAGLLGAAGAVGWIQIQLGDSFVFGKDEIRPYMYILNSMDGSKRLSILTSTTRIVCQNTLNAAQLEKSKASSWYIMHTESASWKIDAAKNAVIHASRAWKEMQEQIRLLSDTRAPASFVDDLISEVFGEYTGKDTGRGKTLRENMERDIYAIHASKTCKGISGDSLWSGLNAVTQWIDHESIIHGKDEGEKALSRFESNITGTNAKKKDAAFRFALAQV